jgi:hypothetical protein
LKGHQQGKKEPNQNVKKVDGSITKDKGEIEEMARQFFQELYVTDPNVQPHEIWDLYEPKISQAMNDDLCKEVTE